MLPEIKEIAKRRGQLGLTQIQLAKQAGVDRGYIAKIERGLVNPTYKQAKKIFETLEKIELERLREKRAVTAGKIHNTPIEYANDSERVYEVWQRMKRKAYSQLPVKSDKGIVGSITEKDLSSKMLVMGIEELRDLRVRAMMGDPFPQVDLNTPSPVIISILQNYTAVLTTEGSKVMGIITYTDLTKLFESE